MLLKDTPLKPIILIIDDDNSTQEISNYLEYDYRIIRTRASRIIHNLAIELSPSLILINGNTTGYKLCAKFKQSFATLDIPIIFYVSNEENFNPAYALRLGALDYIHSTLDPHLVKLKIKNFIELYHSIACLKIEASSAKELNPNTGLPGNTAIITNIYHALHLKVPTVVVYVDLDNFKAYNDKYGFGRGDIIINLTANIIKNELNTCTGFTFIGHIGGDDFVFIAPESEIERVTKNIIAKFDKEIINFYSPEDQREKCIVSKSRRGNIQKFPIMTISMGGVNLTNHDDDTRFETISDLCSEVKKHAKTFDHSCYYVDRRHKKNDHHHLIVRLSSAI